MSMKSEMISSENLSEYGSGEIEVFPNTRSPLSKRKTVPKVFQIDKDFSCYNWK
jgi:hypothetical protein